MVLKDDEIKSLMRALKESRLRPYTEEERIETDKKIADVIERRKQVKEYIERSELLNKQIDPIETWLDDEIVCVGDIKAIPAANVKEVVYTSWERPVLMNGHWYRRCTNCFFDSPHGAADNKNYIPSFCSNCGAQTCIEGE